MAAFHNTSFVLRTECEAYWLVPNWMKRLNSQGHFVAASIGVLLLNGACVFNWTALLGHIHFK